MSKLSRRKFLLTAGVTAAGTIFVHGCTSGTNSSTTAPNSSPAATAVPAANINPADAPETPTAT
jgi:nitrate/nitrite transport system substrate-binding protein